MQNSSIEWTDHTFNPWIGCTKVSPGCDHCYAEASMDKRLHVVQWGAGRPRKRSSDANWRQPLRWNAQAEREGRRFRVFCASLADVFDNEVPHGWRVDLLRLIESTPNLDWLLLTKRVGNVDRLLDEAARLMPEILAWPLPNVWLGATVVNQEEVDRDIPKLLAVPAAKRFLSIEPMLGPVDLGLCNCDNGSVPGPYNVGGVTCPLCNGAGGRMLDWVIVGGESGPGARPFNIEHARAIVRQCQAAGVPVFVKQIGVQPRGWCAAILQSDAPASEFAPDHCDLYEAHETAQPCPGRCFFLTHGKGGDPAEWPEDLRVRQFP
jgi:protein gp37